MCLLCADHLACKQQLHRDTFSHQARQTLRSPISGNDPELYFGLTELRILGGQTHSAGHRDLTAATKCESIDARDHWLTEILD